MGNGESGNFKFLGDPQTLEPIHRKNFKAGLLSFAILVAEILLYI